MGLKSAPDTKTYAESLSGRLHALANAHALVSRDLHEVGRKPRTGDVRSLVQLGPIVMLNGWLHFQTAKHGVAVMAHYHDVWIR